LHTLPVCREPNIGNAIKYLKNCGFRVVAATEKAKYTYTKANLTDPTCIVMGAEDKGIPAEHLALCDEWISIPQFGHIQSLNVSVAAGVTLHQLSEMSGQGVPVFRAIPNTAVEALCGVTVMAHHGASAEQVSQVQDLFSVLGYALIVEEKLIPAATSLTSCGIAFAMRYIRAAMEGGVELGFRPDEAARLVEHTVKGAATLLLESGMHPEAAIDKVTTAGGITIKGLNAMERAGFTNAVIEGLKASR
jgi:pyrroline-5-carboxylate reductase